MKSERLLLSSIQEAKAKDRKAMQEVLDSFEPLILSTTRYHRNEDIRQDLRAQLISVIYKMPSELLKKGDEISYSKVVAYIQKSMRNSHITLSKKREQQARYEVCFNEELEPASTDDFTDSVDMREAIRDALDRLPVKQQEVAKLRYYDCLSDSAIGERLNISRQAVAATRNRALKTLRRLLSDIFGSDVRKDHGASENGN